MSRTTAAATEVITASEDRARQRAQEAVQEALDRRDNGGDGATATDN